MGAEDISGTRNVTEKPGTRDNLGFLRQTLLLSLLLESGGFP